MIFKQLSGPHARLFCPEKLGPLGQDFLLTSIRPPVLISDLTKVEFVSAITRWTRTEEINDVQAIWVENTFNRDVNAGLYVSRRIMPAHFNQAEK